MTKNKKEEINVIATLLSVFPPFALLVILAGWFKGNKISSLSLVGAVAAIVFSVLFAVLLYKPL
ncbi:hypothetical protein [Pedobacter nyackensis]|uniref:hypothetical protein n=1 Tax=Pedobacter nyackensis TaxID=475255 RepID=UPI00292CC54F|nr:hypothetical protein [Pedobacter nyackensis]